MGLRLPELDGGGRDADHAPSLVDTGERGASGVFDRVAAAPPGVQCQRPLRGNDDTEPIQIVHDPPVKGIDAARERHTNPGGLFEDLIVEPGVFQVAALWRVRDGRAAVGNRIGIDTHADASLIRWR